MLSTFPYLPREHYTLLMYGVRRDTAKQKAKIQLHDPIFVNNVLYETLICIISSSRFKILIRVLYNNEHNSRLHLKRPIQLSEFKTECSCDASLFSYPSSADLTFKLLVSVVGKNTRLSRGLTAVHEYLSYSGQDSKSESANVKLNSEHCLIFPTNFGRSIFFLSACMKFITLLSICLCAFTQVWIAQPLQPWTTLWKPGVCFPAREIVFSFPQLSYRLLN
jgi:hypothetical protein